MRQGSDLQFVLSVPVGGVIDLADPGLVTARIHADSTSRERMNAFWHRIEKDDPRYSQIKQMAAL
jgi:hypothetical protein